MMKKISAALVLVLVVLLGACNNNPKSSKSNGGEEDNDSILVQRSYHSSGGLWKVTRGKKIQVDGKTKYILDGENLEYYKTPEGALSSKAIYQNGKREGLFQKFYTNGKLYYEVNYSNGKMEGVKKSYYKTGQIMAEMPYKKGLLGTGTVEYTPDGKALDPMELKVWYKKNGSSVTVYAKVLNKGKVTKRAEFFNGFLIEGKYYHKNLQTVPRQADGTAKITLHNSPEYVVISAKAKSARNNYFFLTKGITIK